MKFYQRLQAHVAAEVRGMDVIAPGMEVHLGDEAWKLFTQDLPKGIMADNDGSILTSSVRFRHSRDVEGDVARALFGGVEVFTVRHFGGVKLTR